MRKHERWIILSIFVLGGILFNLASVMACYQSHATPRCWTIFWIGSILMLLALLLNLNYTTRNRL